jgi:hypothetical protein
MRWSKVGPRLLKYATVLGRRAFSAAPTVTTFLQTPGRPTEASPVCVALAPSLPSFPADTTMSASGKSYANASTSAAVAE